VNAPLADFGLGPDPHGQGCLPQVSEAELAEVVPFGERSAFAKDEALFVLGMTHSIATQCFPDPRVHEATEHLVEKSLSVEVIRVSQRSAVFGKPYRNGPRKLKKANDINESLLRFK
jgi:hypothetical protein